MAKKKKKTSLTMAEKDITQIKEPEIDDVDIAVVAEEWTKFGGANINIQRISPNFIDGLKPVMRRLLYALHTNPNHGSVMRKVARVGGDTIQYHPHGDDSINDVVFRMAQPWRNNINFIEAQGNIGNIRGQGHAHPRYPECKLTNAAQYIFFEDMKYSSVPMNPNYDGTCEEPEYFPARIPVVLCNPNFAGIGYGVATNIPPFNVGEVLDATIKLIKDPYAKIHLIPDCPTGCSIVDEGQFEFMNVFGGGQDCKLIMRATYDIDYNENVITITSLPLQTNTNQVVDVIRERKEKGDLKEIVDLSDFSNKGTVDLKITVAKKANPEKVIKKLFKIKTGLQNVLPIEIRIIDDYQSKVWGTKMLLLEWIEYRRECVRSIYNKKLMDAIKLQNVNRIYLMAMSEKNRDKTRLIASQSENHADLVQRYREAYGITSVEAETLSKVNNDAYTKDAYIRYEQTAEQVEKDIAEYKSVIYDDDAVDNVIIEQLKEAKKLFATPRKSKVIKGNETNIPIANTEHLIGVSPDGYIKKISYEEASTIGQVGKTTQPMVCYIKNRDNLLVFDAAGYVSRVAVSAINDMNWNDIGVEIERFFPIKGHPVSIIPESRFKELKDSDVFILTKNGYMKRTPVSEFKKIADSKVCIVLTEEDEVVFASTQSTDSMIMYTNHGNGLWLHNNDIPQYKRSARGLLASKHLDDGEYFVNAECACNDCNKIIFITSKGRIKATLVSQMPMSSRGDKLITLTGLDDNEELLYALFANDKDVIKVHRKKNDPVAIPVSSIDVTTRVAKPSKMITLPGGDVIVGCVFE